MITEDLTLLVTAPVRGEGLALLESLGTVVVDPWIDHTPVRVLDGEKLRDWMIELDANVLICEADFAWDPLFELPLVAIGSTRGDPTNVDVAAATRAGVPVLHAPGRNAAAVAEMTVALLYAVTRHVVPGDADVRAGRVFGETLPYQRYRAHELAGRTIGLVGLGAVGREVKWRMEGLGLHVISTDPFAPDATHQLEELLAESDIVSIHAPANADTAGMIGGDAFDLMRPGVVFVNTARAAIHDDDALVSALRSGRVAAAALDHFDGEQLPAGHPLLGMPNVVLTPHIGGATYETEARHSMMIAEDLARLLRGERPHRLANPEVLVAPDPPGGTR